MASVNLNNLTKKWGDFTAVDNFNLKILDKELKENIHSIQILII